MLIVRARILILVLTLGYLTSLIVQTVAPAEAKAATRDLRLLEFNACDQWKQLAHGDPDCYDNDPRYRAALIVQYANNHTADVITLQEVCQGTFATVLARLGSGFKGYFKNTWTTQDGRCGTAGGGDYWGIGFIARTATVSGELATYLGHTETWNERRIMMCGNVTVGSGFRLCSTHLSHHSDKEFQMRRVAEVLGPYSGGSAAVVLGADTNIDVRNCGTEGGTYMLNVMYRGVYGGGCPLDGTGDFLEVDMPHAGGDGVYDEVTFGLQSTKTDYIFFNPQRFGSSFNGDATPSVVSDHAPLTARATIHD